MNESSRGSGTAQAILTPLDGAVAGVLTMPEELGDVVRIASDNRKPRRVRVEAYEDLIASEVGDTTLYRARNVERAEGLRQLYLKFEGGNPTGTQKDRVAFAQVHDALRRGFDTVTVATCGNYGAALAMAASLGGLRCVIHVPESYRTQRLDEMTQAGVEIVRTDGDYEAAVDASRQLAAANELYDANPGGSNTSLQLLAYGEIARELYEELRDSPAALCVPVSNGTTLAGIFRGFVTLHRRGKVSRLPRMVAGSSHRKNPIVYSWTKQLAECVDLDPTKVRDSEVNEPLINWRSSDGQEALEAIRRSDGWAADVTDREMVSLSKMLREQEGLSVLPASTAGLAALLARHRTEPLPADRYVAVLTGRK